MYVDARDNTAKVYVPQVGRIWACTTSLTLVVPTIPLAADLTDTETEEEDSHGSNGSHHMDEG